MKKPSRPGLPIQQRNGTPGRQGARSLAPARAWMAAWPSSAGQGAECGNVFWRQEGCMSPLMRWHFPTDFGAFRWIAANRGYNSHTFRKHIQDRIPGSRSRAVATRCEKLQTPAWSFSASHDQVHPPRSSTASYTSLRICSLRVRPSYEVRKRLRLCSSGTTLRQNASWLDGNTAGATMKPSQDPELKKSSS